MQGMDDTLMHISPIDGRYKDKVKELEQYFSEFALFKYRLYVEIEYFISLTEIPLPQLAQFDHNKRSELRNIYKKFTPAECMRIKEIERTINHDVKAVEYYIKDAFDTLGLEKYKEFIHFGLTSQDINNTAVPISFRDALLDVYAPIFEDIIGTLSDLANTWGHIPMLARTHGQPASPTMLGKEIRVFIERLNQQRNLLNTVPFCAKFGGATGNFNAHFVAYPDVDWIMFADQFVSNRLNLHRYRYTTQIEHYDNLSAAFDALKRINIILVDMCRIYGPTFQWTISSKQSIKMK